MSKNNINQRGFGHLLIPIIVIVLAVVGFAGYKVLKTSTKTATDKPATANSEQAKTATTASWPTSPAITWEATGDGKWISLPYDTTPPACPDPMSLELPTTEIKKATSILYPGQSRTGTFEGKGGTYKAHGGIRFDKNSDNNVDVVMPFNGSVFRASRFLVDGEIQYDFDIANVCGVMIRLGHLRDLTPAFQAIADKLPAAAEGDSRTTKVTPNIPFKTGDKIATAVGFKTTKNVGFDYGVYDLRTNNEASRDAAFNAAHADTAELTSHGLCWLNLVSNDDKVVLKALPAGDTTSGKTSNYCK